MAVAATTSDFKSFHYLENGEVNFSVFDTIKTVKKLDCGVYNVSVVNTPTGSKLEVKVVNDRETAKMHSFKDRDKMDKLFASFFEKRVVKKMEELGFNHKVGVLLYGKEGTGKSTIIKNYYTQMIKNNDAIVFYVNSISGFNMQWDFILKVRAVQDNPIVVIFEEMDVFLTQGGLEANFKKLLDGNESINNCLVFGTTNYIDKIPAALKHRPSRFKYVLNIEGIESEEDIFDILQKLIGDTFESTEIVDFSRTLKGESLDIVKQFAFDKIMDLETYSVGTVKEIGFKSKV